MWHKRKSQVTYTEESFERVMSHEKVMSKVMVEEQVGKIACVTHLEKVTSQITVTEQIEKSFTATH